MRLGSNESPFLSTMKGGVRNHRHSGESRNPMGPGNGGFALDLCSKLSHQRLYKEPTKVEVRIFALEAGLRRAC